MIVLQVAETVVDRVADIARYFPTVVDVGCGRGHIAKTVSSDLMGTIYQCDMSEALLVICACNDLATVARVVTFVETVWYRP